MAEPTTVNRLVVGSTPTSSAILQEKMMTDKKHDGITRHIDGFDGFEKKTDGITPTVRKKHDV